MSEVGDVLVAFCPHCSNRAPQKLVHKQDYFEQSYAMDGSLSRDELPCTYLVGVCQTCQQLLLYHAYVAESEEGFTSEGLVWPELSLHASVPEPIREIYSECARIKNIAPNAFASQIRRALEALCDDRGARSGSLFERLQDLASRNEIPPVLAEMTDILRLIGNLGAHKAEQTVKPGHVWTLDEFFKATVEYVYVAPHSVQEFRKRLRDLEKAPEAGSNDGAVGQKKQRVH